MPDWQNRIVETAEMKVSDLKANPKNWRKHPTVQQNALAGILDEVGWVTQVIWNRRTGHLIDGHLRVDLAAKRKEKTVPVNVVDLSEEEEAMILATFDPISAMAEADKQMLAGLMQSIATENEQVQALINSIAKEEKIVMGGEPAEAPEPQVDRAAELQEQWQTAPGQLWQCGDHRVLCGDSTSADDVARLTGGEKADLVLTDPPYGISVVQRSGVLKGATGLKGIISTSRGYAPVEGDDKPFDPRFLLALGTNQIIFGGNYYADKLPPKSCWLVWDKKEGVGQNDFADCELAWTSFNKPARVFPWMWNGLIRKGDRTVEGAARFHPTQKPVGLFAAILADYSKPSESVLDPFLGSGTTLLACEQLGRRCFGMELSPAYVAVILQRWHDMTGKDPVLVDE